jgi:hypothetical protein
VWVSVSSTSPTPSSRARAAAVPRSSARGAPTPVISLAGGETPLGEARMPLQQAANPPDVGHVDPDAEKVHGYSTVTLLARLRGWSMSCPRTAAT